MEPLFYSTGQVARQLGTTLAAIRTLCENRVIAAETMPQTRWPAADSAPLANRECSTGKERGASRHSPSESPAEPSYEVVSAADQVAITRSVLEKQKIDREIEENEDWFRDRQRRQATAEAVERQRTEAKLAEQRRLRRVHQWTQYALDSLPYDARRAVEMEVHTKVVEAPLRPPAHSTGCNHPTPGGCGRT